MSDEAGGGEGLDNSGEGVGVGRGNALGDSGGCACDSAGSRIGRGADSGRGVIVTMELKGSADGEDDGGTGDAGVVAGGGEKSGGIRSGVSSSGIGVDGVGSGLGS